jgi:hypothetical protein
MINVKIILNTMFRTAPHGGQILKRFQIEAKSTITKTEYAQRLGQMLDTDF